jgi:hypothetical protein
VLNPTGLTFVCEVKVLHAGETSFAFGEIDGKQRRWLTRWAEDGGLGWIGLGVIRQHGQRQFLDYLYLVPWHAWLEMEGRIDDIQSSIPLRAEKGYRTELQERNLDIINQLSAYQLERRDGKWIIPQATWS